MPSDSPSVEADAAAARAAASRRWWPERVRLLLVAEAPPAALDRYFYFENVKDRDTLFRYVIRGLFGATPTRLDKKPWLERLQETGVALMDASVDPLPQVGARLGPFVPDLVSRVQECRPESVILMKATVYDAAASVLRAAEVPVIEERVPFPGSGQQRNFEVKFGQALSAAGWHRPESFSP